MEKDFQRCSVLLHRAWGTSVASVGFFAAPLCKGDAGACGGVEVICIGVQQWNVAGSEARGEDRVRSVGSGHAVIGPGEAAIHLL